jgi:SAM-dependent methyltransferase
MVCVLRSLNSTSRYHDGDPVTAESELLERESVPCPLCDAEATDYLFTARDRLVGKPGEFPVVRCRSCGFVYLNPRPTKEALAHYYPDEYYPIDEARETRDAITVARGLLRRVEQVCAGRSLKILDAGCGTGLFLKFARDAGHEVHGVELSESAVRYGRQVYGISIEQGTLEAADLPAEAFDVVTMWHVLEHTPDPVAALKVVKRVLKPGGVLLFGVPNVDSLEAQIFGRRWFSLDAPRHLQHFSPETARRTVEAAGLRVDRVDHSSGTAGLVYSLMGDLTGVFLRLRGRHIPDNAYHRIAGALGWLLWPVSTTAARAGRGGAIEVFARKTAS